MRFGDSPAEGLPLSGAWAQNRVSTIPGRCLIAPGSMRSSPICILGTPSLAGKYLIGMDQRSRRIYGRLRARS